MTNCHTYIQKRFCFSCIYVRCLLCILFLIPLNDVLRSEPTYSWALFGSSIPPLALLFFQSPKANPPFRFAQSLQKYDVPSSFLDLVPINGGDLGIVLAIVALLATDLEVTFGHVESSVRG